MKPQKSLVILGAILIVTYLLYLIFYSNDIPQSSKESTMIAKERFYKVVLNGSINRIEIYEESWNSKFWI